MTFVLALLAKLTLILATGLLVAAMIRSAAPALRHLILLATLVCGLTLPVAMLVSPGWQVAILPQSSAALSSDPTLSAETVRRTTGRSVQADAPQPNTITATAATAAAPAVAPSVAPTAPVTVAPIAPPSFVAGAVDRGAAALPLAWAIGFLAIIAWLAIGRIRLRRIARNAWPLVSNDWHAVLNGARAESGVTREVRLFSSPVVSTPLTWGVLSPVILLPEDALDWSEDHRRVVLRHEIAHIARRDSLAQLVAGFVCALYWFHPLVWITERRLRAECERACDDRVVSLGTPAAEYASHLLEVARSARAFGAPGFLSVAMARPSQLEGRLLAVLNESRRRVAVSRGVRGAAIVLAAVLMLPLAAFRPVARVQQGQHAARVRQPTLVEYGPQLIVPPLLDSNAGVAMTRPSEKVANTYRNEADTTFQLSAPARNGGTLDLDLKTGGSINITSWDRPEVSVRASLGGRDWRETRVSLRPSDGDVTLESEFIRSSNNQSTHHRFDIQVPRNYNVRIKSAGGAVSLSDVSGRFSGSTGGGQITIRNANGDVDIRTGGGQINVSDSNLNGTVSTGGGRVSIIRVNGSLHGSSGSGPVIYSDSRDPKYSSFQIGAEKGATISASAGGARASASSISTTTGDKTTTTYIDDGAGKGYGYGYGTGAIRMSAAGGALSLPSAPDGARVTTGGGRIYIGPSGGEVYARTGGGPIDIGPATGSVAAHTGAGDINIELKGAGSHDVDVTSGKGQVVLEVPSDLNATLELETAYTNNFGGKTRIVSDWPLSITETSDWDASHGTPRKYVRVRQNIGKGGAVIRVRTVNGNIVFRRSR